MATTTKTWQNFIKNQTGSEGGLAKEQTYSVFFWGSSLTNRIEYGNPFNELNELVLFYRLLHRRPPCQALVRDSCPGGADYPAVIFIFSTLIFVTKHFDICRVTLTNICNFDIWSRFPCCVFYIFHFILDSCVCFCYLHLQNHEGHDDHDNATYLRLALQFQPSEVEDLVDPQVDHRCYHHYQL